MNYAFADAKDLDAIVSLLNRCKLPSNDLNEHLNHFIVAKEGDRLIGCVGLEPEGPLLRSLAVDPDHRGRGVARELCARLLAHARQKGAHEIYLLTDTASKFFDTAGFQRKDRKEAPERIAKHKQFTELCPSSAVLMWKEL